MASSSKLTADGLETVRMRVVSVSALASTGLYAGNCFFGWGWPVAMGVALALVGVFAGYAIKWRDGVVVRLALTGIVAGCMILLSDWYCITYGGLVYERGGPFLFLSPLYIPLSFVSAMVQLGCLSHSLERRYGIAKAVVVTAMLGTLYVPLYEFFAKEGHLWHYNGGSLILDTVPYYIVFGELLLSVGASFMTHWIVRQRWTWAVLGGVLFGGWIGGSMVVGKTLFP